MFHPSYCLIHLKRVANDFSKIKKPPEQPPPYNNASCTFTPIRGDTCPPETTAEAQGFKAIQGLIRLYIRQGLDKDNANYSLAKDTLFLQKLQNKGVSQAVIDEALKDTTMPMNQRTKLTIYQAL